MAKKRTETNETAVDADQEIEQKPDEVTPEEEEFDEPEFENELSNKPAVELIVRPAIICGICESCGGSDYVGGKVTQKIDKDGNPVHTYSGGKWTAKNATTCKHYKGVNIACSYCGEPFTGAKNRGGHYSEILSSREVQVYSFAETPKRVMMVCSGYECQKAHHAKLANR